MKPILRIKLLFGLVLLSAIFWLSSCSEEKKKERKKERKKEGRP